MNVITLEFVKCERPSKRQHNYMNWTKKICEKELNEWEMNDKVKMMQKQNEKECFCSVK